MANESVGGVSYSVDVDYGELDMLGSKIDQVGNSAKKSFSGIDYTVGKASAGMGRLSKTSAAVTNAFKVQKGASQQLSWQLQDIVVQAQMGTSWFTILGQQSPQILSLAGAGGALLGVVAALAAAVGGVLYKAFADSSDSAGDLEKTMEELEKITVKTDAGISALSDELVKLSTVSKQAALAETVAGIVKAEKAAKQAAESIKQSFNDDLVGGFLFDIQDAIDQIVTSGGSSLFQFTSGYYATLRKLGEGMGATGDDAIKLGGEIANLAAEIEKTKSPEAFKALQERLAQISIEAGRTNPKLVEFISGLNMYFSSANDAAEASRFLSDAFKQLSGGADIGTLAEKSAGDLSKLIEKLREAAFTYGMSERGVALYTAEQLKATDAQKALINAYFDAMDAAEQDIETKKKSREETEAQIKEFDKLKEKLSEQILELQDSESAFETYIQKQRDLAVAAGKNADEIESLIRLQKQLKDAQKQDKVENKRESQVSKLEEEIRLQQIKIALGNDEFEVQSAIAALGKDATTGEIERITALVTQMQALRFEAELLGPTLEQSFSDTMLSSLDQFSRGMADIILSGASAREVFHSLASTIATELLTAIIRYYVGQAAASLLGISTTTAAGVAQAATLTAAYTPAAIAANIATFGAAATAAAATAPLAATATIAAVSSGSLGAGRLYGGPVGGGKLYPFMENGKPEALEMGGKTYLWTGGGSGNVVSNGEMSKGAASNITVQMNIVNNASGATVESGQARKVSDDKYIVDVVVNNLNERGRIHGAVTGTTTAGNRI